MLPISRKVQGGRKRRMHLWRGVQHSRVQAGSRRVNHIFSYHNMPASLLEMNSQPIVWVCLQVLLNQTQSQLAPSAAANLTYSAFSFPLCGVANY